MARSDSTIIAEGLHKRYGGTAALDGFDLTVPAGAVYGLLGPNGAGKTTAVRILTTLVRLDAGRAQVAGFDVTRQAEQVRHRIGLVGQHPALDETFTGRQNLILFGRLFHLGARAAASRADALLEQFGLADTGRKTVKQYSGGMRRRLDIAASLILAPAVLFLDEPTSGLDPRGRNEVWQAVRELVAGGTTVLLTTQYLDEADQLADRIAVLSAGKVIADGTPDELKSATGADRVEVQLRDLGELNTAAAAIEAVTGLPPALDQDNFTINTPVRGRSGALATLVRALDNAGVDALDVALRRPTLDEVFLRLTDRTGEGSVADDGRDLGDDSGHGGGRDSDDKREVAV